MRNNNGGGGQFGVLGAGETVLKVASGDLGGCVGGVGEVRINIDGISYSGKEYAFLQKLNSIEEKLDKLCIGLAGHIKQ